MHKTLEENNLGSFRDNLCELHFQLSHKGEESLSHDNELYNHQSKFCTCKKFTRKSLSVLLLQKNILIKWVREFTKHILLKIQ